MSSIHSYAHIYIQLIDVSPQLQLEPQKQTSIRQVPGIRRAIWATIPARRGGCVYDVYRCNGTIHTKKKVGRRIYSFQDTYGHYVEKKSKKSQRTTYMLLVAYGKYGR